MTPAEVLCIGADAQPLPNVYKYTGNPTLSADGAVSVCEVTHLETGQKFECRTLLKTEFGDKHIYAVRLSNVHVACVQQKTIARAGKQHPVPLWLCYTGST